MKESLTQQRLIFDIAPHKSVTQSVKHISVDYNDADSKPVDVTKNNKLKLQAEHATRLKFYSTLAVTNTPLPRVRRQRNVETEYFDEESQFTEEIKIPELAVDSADIDPLFAIDMDDIISKPRPLPKYPTKYDRFAQRLKAVYTSLIVRISNLKPVSDLPGTPRISVIRLAELRGNMINRGSLSAKINTRKASKLQQLSKQNKTLLVALIAVICALGLAFIVASFINNRQQNTLQATDWQQSQAQWQCTLQQYETQTGIATSNNKETSCLNQK